MRARYAAYALGRVSYILDTTHPEGPHWQADRESWRSQVQAFCSGTRFVGLQVEDAQTQGDRAWVRFRASLQQQGQDASLTEQSEFRRAEGRWLYFGAQAQTAGSGT